jgi:hypothetical protein
MLHAGLDLSRARLDVCVLDPDGATVAVTAVPPDADGLRGLTRRLSGYGQPVRAAIESMNGARFVHDQLELAGWQVQIADALKVKGLAPLACKTDRIDARVLAELSRRDLVPAIWLPDPQVRGARERARFGLHLVQHRSSLRHRIHATLLAVGHPCPVSDLFGAAGRQLLDRLQLPEPWRGTVAASLRLLDDLEDQITSLEAELRRLGATHPMWKCCRRCRESPGCWAPPSPPSWATSPGLPHPPSLPATPGCARGSTSPGSATGAARCPSRAHLPALGAAGGRYPRLPPPHLPGPLPAHQGPPRPPAWRQGRPDRRRPPVGRGDLAPACPQPTIRSGRCQIDSGRLTALCELHHRSDAPIPPGPPPRRR